MKNYRTIIYSNALYKVMFLANGLKVVLSKFITPNQSVFVKDRVIMENVLLASELVKNYHKDTISPRSVVNIDISKAFDSIQGPFLRNTLTALNFHQSLFIGL